MTTAHRRPRLADALVPVSIVLFFAIATGRDTTAALAATPPALVHYQGVLRNASGAPLDGTYDMIFRFTTAPAGGVLLLTDLHTGPDSVVVTKGLFSALLGGGTLAPGTEPNLLAVVSNHEPVYLEIQVGAETLAPRVRLVSTAFAVNAGRLEGQPAASFIDVSSGPQTKAGALTANGGVVGNAPGASVGVDGTSVSGPGVRGVSTTTSGTAYGTFGRSASAAGVGAYGEATAASGAAYGVYGKSASATGIGAYGEATATSGMAWGVQGKSASSSGIGVIGSALAVSGSTEGVRGQSTSPEGRGVVGGAFATSGDARGVYGETQSIDGTGVYGRATTNAGGTTGVGGDCFSTLGTGVAGVANATSGDAWGVYGATLSSQGYGVVADGDSATIGDIYATGTKFFITEHPDDPAAAIRYACLEGGEVGVYHRGVGRLEDGEASIRLPEHFPMVASGHMTVYVTPLEDCGGLYVPASDVGSGAFTVRELGGGRGSAAFSYVIMAERSGFEDLEVVRPVTLAQKVLMSPRLTPPQKAAIRRALGRREGITLDADEERDLFALVQGGDFEGACRRLGGCAIAAGAVAPGPAGEVLGGSASRQGGGPLDADALHPGGAATAADPPGEAARQDATGRHDGRTGSVDRERIRSVAIRTERDERAEIFRVAETVESGDVLTVGPEGALARGRLASDPAAVGIVAGEPGAVYGDGEAPVAVMGTVLCKADASYGAIAPGDLLAVSPTAGHAMRASSAAAGTILGKALEPLAAGTGPIRVLVLPR